MLAVPQPIPRAVVLSPPVALPVQPSILQASPNSGIAGAGNTSVLLTGTGFLTVNSVKFGTTPAEWFNVVDDGHIWCMPQSTTTTGATTVTVSTANPSGGTALTASVAFTFTSNSIAGTSSIFLFSTAAQSFVSYEGACLGSDGNLWAASHRKTPTSGESPFIQRIVQILLSSKTIGLVTQISTGNSYHVTGPVSGPGGHIWTASHDGFCWKIPVDGSLATKVTLPGATGEGPGLVTPSSMAVVAGSIWIGGYLVNDLSPTNTWHLWRVSPDLRVTTFLFPNTLLKLIFAGTDGLLWGVDNTTTPTSKLYKISPAGVLTLIGTFTFAPAGVGMLGVSVGPDGKIYIISSDFGSTPCCVTQVDPTNLAGASFLTTFPTNNQPNWIMPGPDGNMWVAVIVNGSDALLFKISTSLTLLGTVDITGSSTGSLFPYGGSVGLNGKLYYAMPGINRDAVAFAEIT